ncbi:hypothetical protein ACHAXS_007234 [Conticribra weissflogii]
MTPSTLQSFHYNDRAHLDEIRNEKMSIVHHHCRNHKG